MVRFIREMWDAMQDMPRNFLDESGLWPRDIVPKMVIAATYMVVVCLMAHYTPFTLEAFVSALLTYGLLVLGWFIFAGICAVVLAAILCIREDMQARQFPSMTVSERREAARLCDPNAGEGRPIPSLLVQSPESGSDANTV